MLTHFINKEYKKKIQRNIKKGKDDSPAWSQFETKLPFRAKKGSLKRICTGEKRQNGVRILYVIVENFNNKENTEEEDEDYLL